MTDEDNPWSVYLSPTAIRALDRLPPKVAAAITEFITGPLITDPHRLSKPLRYELTGWHVARRGDYRVTSRMLDDEHTLLIARIEHRAPPIVDDYPS